MEMEQHRPYAETIPKQAYQRELHDLQLELVKLRKWVVEQGERIVIVFEGREPASKAVPYHHRRDDVVGTPDAHVVVPAALAMRRVPN